MGAPIERQVAQDIAFAYREIEVAENLLKKVAEAQDRHAAPDIRDVFGRRQEGLQLGVPTGESSHQLFRVPWRLAKPIIEAHIAEQRAIIAALSDRAITAARETPPTQEDTK